MRAVFALVLLAALASLSSAAAASQPRIVFAADRAATRNGEIYSFDLRTGVTRDISRSFAYDSGPAVSPDGTSIAFGSMRSGSLGLYVANLDGSDVRLVKQFHRGFTALVAQWAPDGTHLAATATCCVASGDDELWIGTPSGFGVTRWDGAGYEQSAWSRDGRYYAYVGQDAVPDSLVLNVVDASGRLLWQRHPNQLRSLGWSADDRLAWSADGTAHVTTAAGVSLGGFAAQSVAWSPDGRVLAAVRVHSIELRTGGTGAARSVYRPPGRLISGVRWLGPYHLVVSPSNADAELRVDVRNGKTADVDYPYVVGAVSSDQRLIVSEFWERGGRALRVGPILATTGRVIAQTHDCSDDHADPFDHYQFVPGKRMVVYLADCGDPTMDVYSMRRDGTGVRQLTYTAAHEVTPTLSPNGSRIAYVKSVSIGHGCEGCPAALWVMNADGTHAQQLTSPGIKNQIGDWDNNPSWSPDGKWILFDRSAAESILGLFVVSADGGTPRSLHIPWAQHGVWGPHRIAYSGQRGAIWTAKPDGTDRHEIAPRHTCDNGCFYAWTPKGLEYATVKRYVTHSTLRIHSAGGTRLVRLPFAPTHVEWEGASLLVTPETNSQVMPWTEGDVYRVEPDGTLTRLTHGLGAISLD